MIYRREIDGLRALAVLPVILFHAGFQLFSGGFVGVDVFFVISGYLITSIIVLEKKAGKFTVAGFYERRARRILPPLFLVMLACLPLAWIWLLPSDMKDFCRSLVAVSTFSSNILFWRESGYFQTANELKPLLHTWSLAVEEQYYLLFPAFLILIWKFGTRRIVYILCVAALISLGLAQWGSLHWPDATFYILPTRGWELLIGALSGLYLISSENEIGTRLGKLGVSTREALGLIGIALIVYAVVAFDKNTPFPGVYALIPTVGTALIILFANQNTIAGKIIGWRPLVGIGLISYSAYLWHYPLFAFARLRSVNYPSETTFLLLSLLTLVFAYASWRYIESPFRNRNNFSRNKIFLMSCIGSLSFCAIGLTGRLAN